MDDTALGPPHANGSIGGGPAIETKGLRKVFGVTAAVESLDLAVQHGEVFGFLGPNGAGKTTVVKMLLGLIRPTAGGARLLGRPLGDTSVRHQIGYLPEHFRFHEWLTAAEFLDFHARLSGLPQPKRRERVASAQEMVGLSARAGDKLRTFSKGMLQRIGLAQALVHEPALVVLDEPTSGLDPLGRREVRDIIRSLRASGVTVFLNSHLLTEIELVCDRVAIINGGRVVREGLLAELLQPTLEVELRATGVSPAVMASISALGTVLSQADGAIVVSLKDEETIPALAQAVVEGGARLYGLAARHNSLEDFFASVVEKAGDR